MQPLSFRSIPDQVRSQLPDLGDHRSLANVGGAIHRGHLLSRIDEVAQVSLLGVQSTPYFGGIDRDESGKLVVDHLAPQIQASSTSDSGPASIQGTSSQTRNSRHGLSLKT